jgi:hypothetical protein
VGWLKTLLDTLRFRRFFLAKMQQAASNANSSAAATTDPMTMPAIAPGDRPSALAAAVEVLVADEPLEVEVGNKYGLSENCGRTTS